jgi:oxygen-dependent protoporphyrinogen oxidase
VPHLESRLKVAVIGGGIAGLAAAWELRDRAEVTVFEPGRLGGAIRTSLFRGKPVDEGADAFLTRVPDAVDICREVGIESDLEAPNAGRSMLWWEGRLRPLPDGLVLGAPGRLTSLLRSHILSPRGIARAGLDLVLPRRRLSDEPTVRELISSRFGAEVADRLVDPLVGSIYGGWTGQLGAREVVPQLVSTAERSRSLMLGLRQTNTSSGGPIFLAPRRGMGSLVEALVDGLRACGVSFFSKAVDSVQAAGQRVVLTPTLEAFDAAIVATPASEAARVLRGVSSEVPAILAELPTASVALVTAAFAGLGLPDGVNGFLVPRATGRVMTACSFGSNKWPHWANAGETVFRLSAGRYCEDDAQNLHDDELAARLIEELGEALGRPLTPLETRVSRWPSAFPQYLPGHARRVAAVEELLRHQLPTVALAGSSYRGVGIPACVASGRRAANVVLERASTFTS